ncbi:MAG: UDP-3-O-(3-hydroxymyristoyl)glucosamine N-acyltransferase, partial [Bacteroidia bacterium]|nr:UDP-3-O-(3-hydroxymyristoyl)glucosamine N-acyltransferase [Bacteroidia bacterium]
MSKFTAQQVAGLLGGTVEGDVNAVITKLSKIEEGVSGSLSFLSNLQYAPFLYTTAASVVIIPNDYTLEKPVNATLIRVPEPRASFAVLLEAYNQIKNNKKGIEQPSFIPASAQLGEDVYIGAFVSIGENAVIGKNVKIFANSFIGDNTVIGDNTIIYAGVRI